MSLLRFLLVSPVPPPFSPNNNRNGLRNVALSTINPFFLISKTSHNHAHVREHHTHTHTHTHTHRSGGGGGGQTDRQTSTNIHRGTHTLDHTNTHQLPSVKFTCLASNPFLPPPPSTHTHIKGFHSPYYYKKSMHTESEKPITALYMWNTAIYMS